MKSIEDIATEAVAEVSRAREMWGTSFDEKNTLNDWVACIGIYLGRASVMGASVDDVNKNLRKAVGLGLSALYHAENGILTPRHYDNQSKPESLPEIA